MREAYAAVDLGASGGRVIHGEIDATGIRTTTVHRFTNPPLAWPDGLHWNLPWLYEQILDGLAALPDGTASVGVDSWGVDYGLVGEDGRLLGLPYHYRDRRTAGLTADLDAAALYRATGVATLEINTLVQLRAERRTGGLDRARRLLLIADLVGYLLTGREGAERTLAGTSQLLAPHGGWAGDLPDGLRPPAGLLPEPHDPGEPIGPLLPYLHRDRGLSPDLRVRAVASHDTASAVVAVPARRPDFAYISCGTWALVGLELPAPVLTEESRLAGFTNEPGVDRTIRFLKNVPGMWLLSESLRTWGRSAADLPGLLDAAAGKPGFRSVVDPFDPAFGPPGDMPRRIRDHCAATSQPVPRDEPGLVRCIVDSLALAFADTLRQAVELSGRPVGVVHLVGGGSRNELLCRLTADATGLPVVAGPAEATALGNLVIQARGRSGPGTLAEIRELVARSDEPITYEPGSHPGLEEARTRFLHLTKRTQVAS
ncbi:rhamnulokinase [Rhizohabitans arisaemae]|uniref:rhamnulokinase n=1 Tax=Rhizohabitans arisaemae TaxID=2720610 RepID=UPI0024B1C8F7|nr:rhamnulokinase family protein [Rhizohabitans arisaemae]